MSKKKDNGGKGKDTEPTFHELTPVDKRLLDRAVEIMEGSPEQILFQHTVLCQTYLPYRDPKGEREWIRNNGRVSMMVQSGSVPDPVACKLVPVGLPFGTKARLVFFHLNSRALKVGSNVIPLEEGSFTEFVKSMQDPLNDRAVAPNGREINAYKDQLTRLSAATFTLATFIDDRRAIASKPQIIEEFDISFQRDERQRLLFPESITLSQTYWESLQKHAIPLDARAIAALSHNALALDIYQWLAQRLHRIPHGETVLLSRSLLHHQFGEGYARERKFWEIFKDALRIVLTQYRDAHVMVDAEGMHLRHSLPPVPKRLYAVPQLPRSKPEDAPTVTPEEPK